MPDWNQVAHCQMDAEILAAGDQRIIDLEKWVADLQSGMYVNCVYCGHRYGPGSTTPVSMADALKAHIEICPKHPMSALKVENQNLREEVAHLDRLHKLDHSPASQWRDRVANLGTENLGLCEEVNRLETKVSVLERREKGYLSELKDYGETVARLRKEKGEDAQMQEVSREDFRKITEGMEGEHLDLAPALGLLSFKLVKREPDIMVKLKTICSWKWFIANGRTAVFLYGGPQKRIVSIGWAQCNRTDPYNQRVGVSIALVRALRNISLPKVPKR